MTTNDDASSKTDRPGQEQLALHTVDQTMIINFSHQMSWGEDTFIKTVTSFKLLETWTC